MQVGQGWVDGGGHAIGVRWKTRQTSAVSRQTCHNLVRAARYEVFMPNIAAACLC